MAHVGIHLSETVDGVFVTNRTKDGEKRPIYLKGVVFYGKGRDVKVHCRVISHVRHIVLFNGRTRTLRTIIKRLRSSYGRIRSVIR